MQDSRASVTRLELEAQRLRADVARLQEEQRARDAEQLDLNARLGAATQARAALEQQVQVRNVREEVDVSGRKGVMFVRINSLESSGTGYRPLSDIRRGIELPELRTLVPLIRAMRVALGAVWILSGAGKYTEEDRLCPPNFVFFYTDCSSCIRTTLAPWYVCQILS